MTVVNVMPIYIFKPLLSFVCMTASTDDSFFFFQATAPVTIEALLTGVQLLVDGKDSDVIVAKNKRTLLEAVVSPPGAANTSHFFWYLNEKLQRNWLTPQLHIDFTKTGEVRLQVLVENHLLSRVVSPEVRVLVVERLGDVRGLADHHSVHVRQARNYTVLVDHGSNITYEWVFGDFQDPVTTDVPTATHTYWLGGTYTLTVTLTTPLGDFRVTSSEVFVLHSGTCDTPKVLGFYPKDTASKREVSPAAPRHTQPVSRVWAPCEGGKNVGPFRLRHDSRKRSIKWIFVAQNDIPQSPF